MKAIFLIGLLAFTLLANELKVSKIGFLTAKSCALKKQFMNCKLENFVCSYEGCYKDFEVGDRLPVEFVLYVHKEQKSYNLDLRQIKPAWLDKFINQRNVFVFGGYDFSSNKIYVEKLEKL